MFLHTGTQEHFDSLVRSGRWAAIPDHQIPYGVALEMADRLDAIAKKPKRQSTGTNDRGQNCWEPNEPCGRACRPKGTCNDKAATEPKKARVTKADVAKKIAEKKAALKTEATTEKKTTPKPKKQSLRSLMQEHGIKRKDYDAARAKAVDDAIATLEKKAKSGAMSQDESQSQIAKIRKASSTALTKTFGAKAVESILASRKNAPPQPEPTPKKPRKTKAKAKVPDPTPTPDPVPPKKAEKPVTPKPVAPKPDPKSEPEDSGTSSVTPTLKAKSFNPHAQPDLSLREFKRIWEDKKLLGYLEGERKTLSFEDWSKGNKKPSKSAYQRYLQDQISGKVPVPRKFVSDAGVKISKRDEKQMADNDKAVADMRARIDNLQKAIDYPLVSDEESRGFKHRMTPEEANAYTAGSFTGDMKFYHGNTRATISSMDRDGIQPDRNARGIYGKGAYFGSNKGIAREYQKESVVGQKTSSGFVEIQAKVKNPFVVTNEEFHKLATSIGADPGKSDGTGLSDSDAIQHYLRATGYDSMYIQDYGYLVTFDPKQSVITELTYAETGSPEEKQAIEEGNAFSNGIVDRNKKGDPHPYITQLSEHETSRKLSKISASRFPDEPAYDDEDDFGAMF